MKKYLQMFLLLFLVSALAGQTEKNGRKFEQLAEKLPTPNVYRTGSGAPGHMYWQQKADYVIDVEVNDDNQYLYGTETITYTNNSPDQLSYVWLQLDQNMRAKNSNSYKIASSKIGKQMGKRQIERLQGYPEYDGGHKIAYVKDGNDKDLPFTIHQTMMRVDLPKAMKSGDVITLKIKWSYHINDRNLMGGRGGHEKLDDGNYLYTITQWFPRMAVYDDYEGWQNKQFLGRGEFALVFGDYKVNITVPADHIVASTGELQNGKDVLTKTQLDRFEKSKTAKKPLKIVTLKEAQKASKSKSKKKKTWTYHAENVRDFAFGTSRRFVWDAMGVNIEGRDGVVMAMSYYPEESYYVYEKYSTEAVAQTLHTYSKFTFPYPYPVAISVEASNGMEYPMICFNYGRNDAKDGTYSERTKYGAIGVIIHEVGHNFFPMIVNSDERQWTWMDEGLNTFVQFLTEQEMDFDYPNRRGPAKYITRYMKGDKENISPIMTNSENIHQFGNNAYGKPATALNILRESVMGRELFDYSFKEYSRRWMFKHPKPADLFRTMEDASAFDLDWFWNGWFYSTDHVDIDISDVQWYKIDTRSPEDVAEDKQKAYDENFWHISRKRNKEELKKSLLDKRPYLKDFYNTWNRFEVENKESKAHKAFVKSLDDQEEDYYESDWNFYQITFDNVGGLVMPLFVQFIYEDGSKELQKIPAEIWRTNNAQVTKVFITKKKAKMIVLDPNEETADTETSNNYFPRQQELNRFKFMKQGNGAPRSINNSQNPMQKKGIKLKN